MRKTMLKIISMTAAFIIICSSLVFADVPADVVDSAHKDAITALVDAGVITGSTDGLFHPFDNLTRAEACIIIVKSINPPDAIVTGTPTQKVPASGFADMVGYKWADGYISYAVRNGIVKGYPDGTFRPGNNVTCDEMLTMVLRAAGFKDSEIGNNWPKDFVIKADLEGVTKGLPTALPDLATKEIAAQMAFNKLDVLRAIGESQEVTGEPDGDKTANNENTPWGTGMTFASGKFNNNMTEFAGTPISTKIEVYTYGVKADYKKDMKLPEKTGDYRKDTIHKYKLTETSCFYIKTGNEITTMILPMDVGFSGRIYCVINNSTNSTNGKGDKVNNIYTLAAGQQVSWLTKDSTINAPDSKFYLDGEVYELTASDGIITKAPLKASDAGSNKNFVEITEPDQWEKVSDFSDTVISLEGGNKFEVADNVVVYVLNSDGKSYKVGKTGNISKGSEIRAFSITEDGEVASHITVKGK